MWREEFYLEGFRFIGTAEYNQLKEKVGKGWKKPWLHLTKEEWMNYYLYKFRIESYNIQFDGQLRDGDSPDCLGTNLVILAEIERRINLVLGRPQKTIKESIIDNRIEEVCLLDDETEFKLSKLLRPKRIDMSTRFLHKRLKEDNYFENKMVVYGNTNLYNISPTEERLGFLLEYREALKSRIKFIRSSKEYQWAINSEGLIIGSWGIEGF